MQEADELLHMLYHFVWAFRQSFDEPPHAYVMRRRIERAQGGTSKNALLRDD
jgi:hypothetical protein